MGLGQSQARKLTMENETFVTEGVVARIRTPPRVREVAAKVEETPRSEDIEQQIEKNNKYWDCRLERLRRNQEIMAERMNEEIARTIEEMDKLLPKWGSGDGPKPCTNERLDVVECYRGNCDKPLLCAGSVKKFARCMVAAQAAIEKPLCKE